jgi:hypothetical protein
MITKLEDAYWTTNDGRTVPLQGVDDDHLANIIKWVNDNPDHYTVRLLQVLHEMANQRGLSAEFLAGAKYPYEHQRKITRNTMSPPITEDSRWTSYEGRRIALKDLEDTHLANIIRWVNLNPDNYNVRLLQVLTGIAKRRELSEEFLAGAEYPHRNKNGETALNLAPIMTM